MCGIFGFVGNASALQRTLAGLSKLEYRGYDSAGAAFFENGAMRTERTTEKIAALREQTRDIRDDGAAIAHTRWATHGEVSVRNAHPHSCGRVTLVHNGILENYREILRGCGKAPLSDTDTEAAAILIDSLYRGDPAEAVRQAAKRMRGAFALGILFSDRPGEVYCIHRESPLTVLETAQGCYLSSDPAAFSEYGRDYIVPGEDAVTLLTAQGAQVFGDFERLTLREADRMADKGEYEYYMEKEIREQPAAIRDTILSNVQGGSVRFPCAEDALFDGVEVLHIIGCGTAMHAGCTAAPYVEDVADVPVQVHVASEFVSSYLRVRKQDLYVYISQSGETADTLAALRRVKSAGGRVLSVINKRGTTMERESGNVVFTFAGPEIAVASTKAFTAQLAALYLIAMKLARSAGRMAQTEEEAAVRQMLQASAALEDAFALWPCVEAAAKRLAEATSLFYLGRGTDYALAREGALKIKEISYIHAEAVAAGEMKHGVISLIQPDSPSIMFLTRLEMKDKILLSAREIASRGGPVTFVVTQDMAEEAALYGNVLPLPACSGPMSAFAAAAALQMLAFETAKALGRPIDQPRNLAKAVTVA